MKWFLFKSKIVGRDVLVRAATEIESFEVLRKFLDEVPGIERALTDFESPPEETKEYDKYNIILLG